MISSGSESVLKGIINTSTVNMTHVTPVTEAKIGILE
jgi:hypothetical protein